MPGPGNFSFFGVVLLRDRPVCLIIWPAGVGSIFRLVDLQGHRNWNIDSDYDGLSWCEGWEQLGADRSMSPAAFSTTSRSRSLINL